MIQELRQVKRIHSHEFLAVRNCDAVSQQTCRPKIPDLAHDRTACVVGIRRKRRPLAGNLERVHPRQPGVFSTHVILLPWFRGMTWQAIGAVVGGDNVHPSSCRSLEILPPPTGVTGPNARVTERMAMKFHRDFGFGRIRSGGSLRKRDSEGEHFSQDVEFLPGSPRQQPTVQWEQAPKRRLINPVRAQGADGNGCSRGTSHADPYPYRSLPRSASVVSHRAVFRA